MAIKRLNNKANYEADDNKQITSEDGIQQRLDAAHIHLNIDVINQVTQDHIKLIEDSLDKDLKRLSEEGKTALDSLLIDKKYVKDIESAGNYLRTVDGWTSINDIEIPLSVEVEDSSKNYINVDRSDNNIKLAISDKVKNAVDNIDNKIDKFTGNFPIGKIIISKSDGGISISDKQIDDLLLKSSLVTSFNNMSIADLSALPVAASVVYDIQSKLNAKIGRVGRIRGFVHNALAVAGTSYTVDSITSFSGTIPSGLDNNTLFGVRSDCIDAEIKLNVDISYPESDPTNRYSFTVLSGGEFKTHALAGQLYSVYVKNAALEEPLELAVELSMNSVKVDNSTLKNIEDPAEGDMAIVMEDETTLNSDISCWMYRQIQNEVGLYSSWCFVCRLSEGNGVKIYTQNMIS